MLDEVENEEWPELPEPEDYVFTNLFMADMAPPKWIIKDLLPPGLVFVGAPPKAGKSTIEMAIACLVAGLKCDVLPPELSEVHSKGVVLGFSAEASAGELRHMVEEGFQTLGNPGVPIFIADNPFEWRLDDPDGRDRLLAWLDFYRPRLCFIDPLVHFHGLDEKDAGEMTRMLAPLQKWAKANDSAVMLVHHTKKKDDIGEGYEALDMRGSGALFAAADAVLMITPLKNEQVRLKTVFNRAQSAAHTFTPKAFGRGGPSDILNSMSDLEKYIIRQLRLGPQTMETLECASGITEKRLADLIALWVRKGLVTEADRLVTLRSEVADE